VGEILAAIGAVVVAILAGFGLWKRGDKWKRVAQDSEAARQKEKEVNKLKDDLVARRDRRVRKIIDEVDKSKRDHFFDPPKHSQ